MARRKFQCNGHYAYYLRHSLFLAASVAKQHDPAFKVLYEKRRAEGKPYTVTVCVVAYGLEQA